ncbi:MAG: lanthionine synthetase [Deltaproteobacteria bacterium]|nr:lanthionine synthetase [Deltaproteobacteria bacterium]
MYEHARHEPLVEQQWDESRARDAIEQIVRDADARFHSHRLWPAHPLDRPHADRPFKMLYFGAAGVIWALDYLHRVGATNATRDYSSTLAQLATENRADLNLSEPDAFSYLMGDVGIQLMQWRLRSSDDLADAIFRSIELNVANPAREFMWGTPGTMLAALFMHGFTGQDRWKELYVKNVGQLLSELVKVQGIDCYTWTQDLYGQTSLYLGAVHGFAANIFSIIKGRELLDAETVSLVAQLAADTLARTATADDTCANWPPDVRGGGLLVQHCHGAPGMITCLAAVPAGTNQDFDRLLTNGGELIWKASPLSKGSNLCHGTAGNGYAFLKLHQRTGESFWLARARAFAMHAIGQWERHTRQYGHMRYSLWTGDLGLAVYLWDCIHGNASFPTMDVF